MIDYSILDKLMVDQEHSERALRLFEDVHDYAGAVMTYSFEIASAGAQKKHDREAF